MVELSGIQTESEIDSVDTFLLDPSFERGGVVQTEGIKYIGSKKKIIPHILELVRGCQPSSVIDLFSGSTRVSQALGKSGYQVFSNDIAYWSEIFSTAYLRNYFEPRHYSELITHLNSATPIYGWLSEHYGGEENKGSAVQVDGRKKLWQLHNTMKADGIRAEIDQLRLSEIERAVALTSLMIALDKVDSSLGHQVAYLKNWAARSYQNMKLQIPMLWQNSQENAVSRMDALDFSEAYHFEADLAYIDPPYGSNNEKMPPSRVRYQSYYHVWTSLVLNDRPQVFGAAARREDSRDVVSASVFEEFRKNHETGRYFALEALEKLLRQIEVPSLILSYSNAGRATSSELLEILEDIGSVDTVVALDYKKHVMSDMRTTQRWLSDSETKNQELLFLVRKS